jgi:non-ribosomal peptide synthetase component E (peptide arylation enzyme)
LPATKKSFLVANTVQAQKNTNFISGEVWKDTDGNPINAHGGGLLYHDGAYYWYGEYKKGKTILRYYDADGYLTQGKR